MVSNDTPTMAHDPDSLVGWVFAMRSEHYSLIFGWARALPLIQLLVFASAYLGIATRLTRLVLSHLERRNVALAVVIGLRVVIIPITLHCD
jgi:hypothetical protein